MKYIIILILALLITGCAKTETIEPEKPMPNNQITQFPYPEKTPSENGFQYLVWGTNGEETFEGYRDWVADAWVLAEGEVVGSFIEIARIPVE